MAIDIETRNEYWKNFQAMKTESDLIYHLAGADKKYQNKYQIPSKELLYYYYRFLLEEKLVEYFIEEYVSEKTAALDCGCGTGRNSIVLKKKFPEVDAFDSSKNFILENKKRFKGINFFVLTLSQVALVKKYDLILIGGMLMYLDDNEASLCLEKMKNLLKENGILVLRDTISTRETEYYQDYKIYRNERDYENLIEKAGYQILKKVNSANRNVFYSLYIRLPQFFQDKIIIQKLFQKAIKLFISLDILKITEFKFKRHQLSNQLFYILRK